MDRRLPIHLYGVDVTANSIIRVCEVCGIDISHKKSKRSKFCSVKCTRIKYSSRSCAIDGCNRPPNGRLYCLSHEHRAKKGLLDVPIREKTGITSTNHNLYARWRSMLDRCSNVNNKIYPNYGGRGIKVCDRWKNFKNFIADMGYPLIKICL